MIVEFVVAAEADLAAIGDHIARDNPTRAVRFVRELVQACVSIAELPEAWPLVPRHAAAGIRRRVHGRYLIFYRLTPGRVTILHVLNGAMDVEALIFPES